MNNLNGPDSIKKGDYGYSSESISRASRGTSNRSNNNRRTPSTDDKKLRRSSILGIILALIQVALSGCFVYLLFVKKNVDYPTLAIIVGVLLALIFVVFGMETAKKLITKRIGKVISVIVSLLLIAVMAFLLYFSGSGKIVNKDPFVVFVSASDTFGSFNRDDKGKPENTRSDTNILAAVNPQKHVVTMVSVPRDYYIPIKAKSVAPDSMEKLTHIGLYGSGQALNAQGEPIGSDSWQYAQEVQWERGKKAIMNSLKKVFKFNVDEDHYHYVQLNFTGFAKLIDELGGIDVKVAKSFSCTTYADYADETNMNRTRYKFKKGVQHMDGPHALTYARERHHFANGDMQRNKNQVAVLKGLSDKLLSPAILLRGNKIAKSVDDCLDTDIDVSSMVTLQSQVALQPGYKGWDIVSYNVIGEASMQPVTWNGLNCSVVLQDDESIGYGTKLLNQTLEGTDYDTLKSNAKTYKNAQGN